MVEVHVAAWGIGGAVRDGGRSGWAHLGRGRGGAVDLPALRLGNRLVGNDEHAAAIETSGGTILELTAPAIVAVTGSPVDLDVSDGPPLGWGLATALPAGARIRIGRLRGGARTYLAVRGGLRRTDDPSVLRAGGGPLAPPAGELAVPLPRRDEIRVWPGPRLDWFDDDAWRVLTSQPYTVLPDSDRIGTRLGGGQPLRRRRDDELPSEGIVEGAVQVPHDGMPIVMLADHPVTGGYPVAAVVDPDDLPHVAQAPVGATLRFRPRRS